MLRLAKEAGCATMNGELMLLYQGVESFKIWTGQEMPINEVKKSTRNRGKIMKRNKLLLSN